MTKEYVNKQLIDKVDAIAQKIIEQPGHCHMREKFFPMLINELGLEKGAEIGVDLGHFSLNILNQSNIKRYYCIDTWQDDFGSDPTKYDKVGKNRMNQAYDNLRNHIDSGRAEMWQSLSTEAARGFNNNSLDFVYIDGDHSLMGIIADMLAWLPKVRIGGIISGHDYKRKDTPNSGIKDYFGNQLYYRVNTVVDDYCARYGYPLRANGGNVKSWWFVVNQEYRDDVKMYLLEDPQA